MNDIGRWIAGTVVALMIAAGGGYLLGRNHEDPNAIATAPGDASTAKPLYYQNPDGKPIYSPTPKKTPDGRDFKPIYADGPGSSTNRTGSAPQRPETRRGIVYYRNPMGLPDVSRVPKKDPMGMDYIPVREGEEDTGVVQVSPARLQMLGVTTAPVVQRPALARTVRATGVIQADESKLASVTTKFDGVVEKLFVSTTGAEVRKGQPLAQVWIQTPDTMMQIGPDVITRQIDYVIELKDKSTNSIAQAGQVLQEYGIPK
jgi:Cu(I)/Ag(I) efflux system membrane fusion protein